MKAFNSRQGNIASTNLNPDIRIRNAEDDFFLVENTSSRVINPLTRRLMVLTMILSDIFSILVAVGIAAGLRGALYGPLSPDSYLWVPAYLLIFILSASLRDLYPATGLSAENQFRNLTITTSMLTLIIIAGTFFIKSSSDFSRLFLGLTWFFSLITVPLSRTIIRHVLSVAKKWGEPAVIIGNPDQVDQLLSFFSRYPKIGLKPEVCFTLSDSFGELAPSQRDQLLEKTQKINREMSIHTVIVAYEQMNELGVIRDIFSEMFDHVILANPQDYGRELTGVFLSQYGRMHTFEIHHTLMDTFAQFQKRIIDIVLSITGLVLLSPILLVSTILVAINSHGHVFYRQRRLGKHNEEFEIIKFRTMVPNADQVLHEYLEKNPDRKAEWDAYQKLSNDPRITFVGRFLRRFSIDELPQLWNVLIGQMSIVGPRPIMINQRDLYGSDYRHYVRVRPGITGIWQISGRNQTSFATRVEFDVEYVMNWSIWMDIYILTRTLWVVIRQEGVS